MFGLLFERERREVHKRLKAAIEEFIIKQGVSPINNCYEDVMGDDAIGEYPSTREMRFFLEDSTLFTPDLALQVKKKVIDYCPKWSIVAQFGSRTFGVKTTGVRFNEVGRTVPFQSMLPKFEVWAAETAIFDEVQKGPLRRQFAHVLPMLPSAIKELASSKTLVLAAFDRYVPPIEDGIPVLWLLTAGSKVRPQVLPGEARLSRPVTKRGVIEAEYSNKYYPTTNKIPSYRLQVHEFAWKDRNTLRVKLTDGSEEVSLPPITKLIKDEHLR